MWNRFKTATELQTWRQGLSDWKDFNSDFGNIYPNGLSQDAESGAYGRASQSSSASASATASSSTAMNPAHRNHSGNGANAKEATDLSQIVVDQDEDEDDSKGVRPLMKVPPLTRAVRVVVVLTSVCRVSCRG